MLQHTLAKRLVVGVTFDRKVVHVLPYEYNNRTACGIQGHHVTHTSRSQPVDPVEVTCKGCLKTKHYRRLSSG